MEKEGESGIFSGVRIGALRPRAYQPLKSFDDRFREKRAVGKGFSVASGYGSQRSGNFGLYSLRTPFRSRVRRVSKGRKKYYTKGDSKKEAMQD